MSSDKRESVLFNIPDSRAKCEGAFHKAYVGYGTAFRFALINKIAGKTRDLQQCYHRDGMKTLIIDI